jgi:hypothetical protein
MLPALLYMQPPCHEPYLGPSSLPSAHGKALDQQTTNAPMGKERTGDDDKEQGCNFERDLRSAYYYCLTILTKR